MRDTIETINFLMSSGALLLLAGTVILLIDQYGARLFQKLIALWGLTLAFFVTLIGSGMTLLYSDVFGFVPCGLCWFQRIFLYPQVFILGLALWRKDKAAARYGIVLSIPGLLVALYQYYLQMGGTEVINCPASAASCARIYFMEFGFITFPMLAASTFIFLIALYTYILRLEN